MAASNQPCREVLRLQVVVCQANTEEDLLQRLLIYYRTPARLVTPRYLSVSAITAVLRARLGKVSQTAFSYLAPRVLSWDDCRVSQASRRIASAVKSVLISKAVGTGRIRQTLVGLSLRLNSVFIYINYNVTCLSENRSYSEIIIWSFFYYKHYLYPAVSRRKREFFQGQN